MLSNNEIFSIIQERGLTPVFDQAAGVKYINWDGKQWYALSISSLLLIWIFDQMN